MKNLTTFSYGYACEIPLTLAQAREKVLEAFQAEGFGMLTEIDVQAKMKEKIDKDMEPYVILGMCSPKLAASALDVEPNIGLLLPCNVIIRKTVEGVVIAAQKPSLFSTLVSHPEVDRIAREAEEKILSALSRIRENV